MRGHGVRQVASPGRRSSSRPSSALAPAGSPSTPLDDTGRTPSARRRGSSVGEGLGAPGLGPLEAHGAGIDGQHQRRLRPAGVRVAARRWRRARRGRRRPRPCSAALTAASASSLPPCALTSTTPAKELRADRTSSTRRSARTSWPTRSVPGKPGVLAAGAVGAPRAPRATSSRRAAQARRHRHGDPGVGVEGEMGPVLLERAQRHRQEACAPRSPPPGARWRRRAPRAQVRAGERKRTGMGTGSGVPSRSIFE